MRIPTSIFARTVLSGACAIAALALLPGCGVDRGERNVEEGQKLYLGDLEYSIQISRFLNPADVEDAAYLEGQRPPANSEDYFAVFVQIKNVGEEAQRLPAGIVVRDSREGTYYPLESDSVFALKSGTVIPGNSEIPVPDSPAATGPIQGQMLLYRVDYGISQKRPVELVIPAQSGEDAHVKLDL